MFGAIGTTVAFYGMPVGSTSPKWMTLLGIHLSLPYASHPAADRTPATARRRFISASFDLEGGRQPHRRGKPRLGLR
jgi:hypothetical protein